MATKGKRTRLDDAMIVERWRAYRGPKRGALRAVAEALGISYSRAYVALARSGVRVRAESDAEMVARLREAIARRDRVTESQARVVEAVTQREGDRIRAARDLGVSRQYVYRALAVVLQ